MKNDKKKKISNAQNRAFSKNLKLIYFKYQISTNLIN